MACPAILFCERHGYADDLAAVIRALDLKDAVLLGHSTGGDGENVCYLARHGKEQVAKAMLIAAFPPLMLKTRTNPEGFPIEVFNNLRNGLTKDRSHFYRTWRYFSMAPIGGQQKVS